MQCKPEGSPYPFITLIGAHGYGYGTHEPISLDGLLFRQITEDFGLASTGEEVAQSIHGVFNSFVEEQEESANGLSKSLLITLSTSKSPMRQSFLSMRINLAQKNCSVTCLLLEDKRSDLRRVVNNTFAPTIGVDWRHPLAFLVTLLQDIGRTSEEKRDKLDGYIVEVEMETNTCVPPPRKDQPEVPFTKRVRWPKDHYTSMGLLHKCNNQLVFAARAVNEEIDAWRQLQRLLEDAKPMWEGVGGVDKKISAAMSNTVKFQLAHTKSRKTQIQGLKERVAVQIDLIHNMTAHQEASQTTMIAIVALIFAPASLIATIFSAGLFATDDHSWTTYIASTVPITVAIFVLGLQFTKLRPVLAKGWKAAARLFRPEGRHRQTDSDPHKSRVDVIAERV
ncbi:hypothetical protein CkaCkLH20_06611 [Colletotrichum karsti]|uniref:Uncharacterized protein n=1 Tax=Colletotrichum karsti TaxID=1095194 RepID=A0A9P6I444_9PEZI|nr:uncharacterized protein CkaCkLH20_06611 [Colletotrichum karsti]KAF9875679.1 hypothetical protein CkaCkLH20_06611 [Colletotrichum karsti]